MTYSAKQLTKASKFMSYVCVTGRLRLMCRPVLYHGTAEKSMVSIRQDGLQSSDRNHVHLSDDAATAKTVGQRHGRPVVIEVNASLMHADGHYFYLSENGVWLTEAVPPSYLAVP